MEARPAISIVRWLPWLLGLTAAAILFIATQPFGIGVTSDCVDYFSTAANLVRGEGFLQHDGNPYASWPPLYPMLLAAGLKVGLACETTALLINMLSVALLLFFLSRWMLQNLRHRFVAHWASLVILLHFALWDVALHAWTEPLFNLLAILFLIQLPKTVKEDRWASLLGLALLASTAWFLRYVGVTLVATGGLFILFASSQSWPKRLSRAAVFGVIAATPTAIWMIRNLQVMGQMAGERSPSAFGLVLNLRRMLKASWWIVPESWGKILPALIFVALLVFLVITARRFREQAKQLTLRKVLRVFSVLYLMLLLYTSTRFAFEAIHSRYLIPVFLPGLLWLTLWLDDYFASLRLKTLRNVLAVLMVLWLIFPVLNTADQIADARSEGIDAFGAPEWRDRPLWSWLEGGPEDVILISNGADALHYHTGLPVRLAPRKWMHSAGRTPTTELADFASIFEEDRPVFCVWIADFPRTGARVNYHSLEELLELYRLEPIVAFPESAVFMVMPR